MSKKALKDLGLLVAICLVAALLLALTNQLSKGPIEQNTLMAAQQTRTQLLPVAATFAEVELSADSGMDSCFQGLDESGESVGYVVETTVNGYGGEVVVTIGLDADNAITGVTVGGENFSETPGLGALSKEPAFTNQYIGKKAPLRLIKSNETSGDDTIDAISGATITSTAVNGGINLAGKYISDLSGGSSPNTASAQGFGGPVAVTLTLDDSGAIATIEIGDDYFNETEGFGKKALEPDFQAQFIGKTPPLALGDIDAISGATITSTAVVNAINTVYGQLTGDAAPVAEAVEAEATQAPTEAPADEAATFANGMWSATRQGFASPVTVKLALDGMTITTIEIGDEQFNETEGFGKKALDSEFQSQFVGKTLPITLDDIDAISGATVTSTAIVNAMDAIYQAASEAAPAADASTAEAVEAAQSTATPAATNTPAPTETPTEAPADEAATFADGAWSATRQGFASPVAVKLTLDGTTITAIEIGDDRFNETEGFGKKALDDEFQSQFIGKTLPITLSDIDAISGATITSTAVVDAIGAICDAVGSAPSTVNDVTTEPAQSETTVMAANMPAETQAVTAAPVATNAAEETATATPTATPTQTPTQAPTEEPAPTAAAVLTDGVWSATRQGFAGPVLVKLTLDDNLTITAIEIGDEQFNETEGFGKKALDSDFQSQFIGKTLPIALEDIDAISGATVTSTAVIDAIGDIYAAASAPAATKNEDGTWTAIRQGFASPVAVKLTLDGLTITAIEIGDEQFNETEGFGKKALDDAFQSQFIGKTLPIALEDIDAISGATITSTAVIDAIGDIYSAVK